MAGQINLEAWPAQSWSRSDSFSKQISFGLLGLQAMGVCPKSCAICVCHIEGHTGLAPGGTERDPSFMPSRLVANHTTPSTSCGRLLGPRPGTQPRRSKSLHFTTRGSSGHLKVTTTKDSCHPPTFPLLCTAQVHPLPHFLAKHTHNLSANPPAVPSKCTQKLSASCCHRALLTPQLDPAAASPRARFLPASLPSPQCSDLRDPPHKSEPVTRLPRVPPWSPVSRTVKAEFPAGSPAPAGPCLPQPLICSPLARPPCNTGTRVPLTRPAHSGSGLLSLLSSPRSTFSETRVGSNLGSSPRCHLLEAPPPPRPAPLLCLTYVLGLTTTSNNFSPVYSATCPHPLDRKLCQGLDVCLCVFTAVPLAAKTVSGK